MSLAASHALPSCHAAASLCGSLASNVSVVCDRRYVIDDFRGEPILPDEDFSCTVAFRRKDEAHTRHHGWRATSRPLVVRTKRQTEAVALLTGKTPRIHLLHPLMFEKNSDEIASGGEAL